jgi:hypothetical protein
MECGGWIGYQIGERLYRTENPSTLRIEEFVDLSRQRRIVVAENHDFCGSSKPTRGDSGPLIARCPRSPSSPSPRSLSWSSFSTPASPDPPAPAPPQRPRRDRSRGEFSPPENILHGGLESFERSADSSAAIPERRTPMSAPIAGIPSTLTSATPLPAVPATHGPHPPAPTPPAHQPNPTDTVTLSQAAQITQVNNQGDSTSIAALVLGIPVVTLDLDLGISATQTDAAAAPTPVAPTPST